MGSCMSSKSEKGALLIIKSKAPDKKKLNKKKMEEKSKLPKSNIRYEKNAFGFKRAVPVTTAEPPTSIETHNTETTACSGTPRLPRPNKDANGNSNVRTNRFGFRSVPTSNKVSDSHSNVNLAVDNTNSITSKFRSRSAGRVLSSHTETLDALDPCRNSTIKATKFTLHTKNLPRPQFPVQLTAPAHYHKSAKTAANNHTARRGRSENGGSSASSVTDVDSGIGSHKSSGECEIIEQLSSSPSIRNRQHPHKSRPMEMVFHGGGKKTFELRDLNDSIEVTEIMPLELPPLPNQRLDKITSIRLGGQNNIVNNISDANSGSDDDIDAGYEEGMGEEKLNRDQIFSEKNERAFNGDDYRCHNEGGEELWAHEEAMAGEDSLNAMHSDSDEGSVGKMLPPLRSVLLSIEDPAFAVLAAASTTTMLEDESFPEIDIVSNPPSFPTTVMPLSPVKSLNGKNLSSSPGSPGTPTHASNSLSFSSDAKDFLIDDEIADQPGLVFDETITASSSGKTLIAHPLQELEKNEPLFTKPFGLAGRIALSHKTGKNNSIGTLSPCESITSDDMMLDFDRTVVDDESHDFRSLYRLDSFTSDIGLLTDGEADVDSELLIAKEAASLTVHRPEMMNGVRATRQLRSRVGSTGSGTNSPRSLDTPRSGISSPLKFSRQVLSSPVNRSEDSGIWMSSNVHDDMKQDVHDIKSQLLLLHRIFHDAGSNNMENYMDYSQHNFKKESLEINASDLDLKRQVVFLQHQLQEKDKTIQILQSKLAKFDQNGLSSAHDVCNAATQTDRIRPLSTGPSLLTSGLPNDGAGGSLVSNMSEVCIRLQQPTETKSHSTVYSRLPVSPWRRQNVDPASKLVSQPVQVILEKKISQKQLSSN